MNLHYIPFKMCFLKDKNCLLLQVKSDFRGNFLRDSDFIFSFSVANLSKGLGPSSSSFIYIAWRSLTFAIVMCEVFCFSLNYLVERESYITCWCLRILNRWVVGKYILLAFRKWSNNVNLLGLCKCSFLILL